MTVVDQLCASDSCVNSMQTRKKLPSILLWSESRIIGVDRIDASGVFGRNNNTFFILIEHKVSNLYL